MRLLFSALFLSLTQNAVAGNTALDFAVSLKGRYASEVKDSEFSRTFTTRTHLAPYLLHAEFDDSTQSISMKLFWIGDTELIDSCRTTGTGIGQNAMGAVAKFRKETCHRLFLLTSQRPPGADAGPYSSYLLKLNGGASEFRRIVRDGIDVEVEFVPVKRSGLLIEYTSAFHEARVDSPTQATIHLYRLPASVRRVSYFQGKSKKAFHTDVFSTE